MTKSELIEKLAAQQLHLPCKVVEEAVKAILEQMVTTLVSGERIEIRGFGSLSIHHYAARVGRNPKTGQQVALTNRCIPHFKPGRELRDRVNLSE